MHPAPSVILFTTFAGLGFGFLAYLGCGLLTLTGWPAFFAWGFGYALAVGGLLASGFHLGNPQRALLAFTQWRSSWLSREAWAACLTLLIFAPQALSDWLDLGWGRGFGLLGAVAALATLICTAMIYAQLKTVPRWNHWLTPVVYLGFALTGGAVLALPGWPAAAACALLALLLLAQWRVGDGAFARKGESLSSATGLGGGAGEGPITVFEQPHTGENYLMREMICVVGRKHAQKLRVIALLLAAALPAVLTLALGPVAAVLIAAPLHLLGALAARWLFFAEAEHVVGLYYGLR